MDYAFVIADVFTSHAFGGNQLAVFPEATGLTDAAMQSLAREFNFAESTFVFPSAAPGCAARVRIFTPRSEVAFAGHPTIGTTAVLASLGQLDFRDGRAEARLELGIGPVAVEARGEGGRSPAGREPVFARLGFEPRLEMPPGAPSREVAAGTLSLPAADVLDAWFAGVGLPFCFVRLVDAAAVDRALLDRARWSIALAGAWSSNVFLFAGELSPGGAVHARMFAPALGIEEDAASGSACAALAGVVAHRRAEPDGELALRVTQGVQMGRPSLIDVSATRAGGRVARVSVGGHSVVVGEGRMHVG
jgi:trans-2,3-dihydro-3-hydroxyanthranilate isomerase